MIAADMNNFGRALAKAVNAKDLLGFTMEQDLQRTNAHTDDLRPRRCLNWARPTSYGTFIAVSCCSVFPTELISGMV